jgi:hypothetical protein
MSAIVKCACGSAKCAKEIAVYDHLLEIRGDAPRPDHAVYLDPNSIVRLIASLRAELLKLSGFET